MRSKILWEENAGLNGSGMSIIPAGNYGVDFSDSRVLAGLWIPKELSSENAKLLYMSSTTTLFKQDGNSYNKIAFQSVRCVMDANNTLIH